MTHKRIYVTYTLLGEGRSSRFNGTTLRDYRKKITSFSQSCIKLTTFGSNSYIFLAYVKKKQYFCGRKSDLI